MCLAPALFHVFRRFCLLYVELVRFPSCSKLFGIYLQATCINTVHTAKGRQYIALLQHLGGE